MLLTKPIQKHIFLGISFSTMLLLSACGGDAPAEPAAPVETPATEVAPPDAPVLAPTEAEVDAAIEDAVDSIDSNNNFAAIQEESAALPAGAGQARYEQTCAVCHASGVAGAPIFGDPSSWGVRAEQGLETLYTHSAEGYNNMPAQAIGDVSHAEVLAAVEYMLAQVQ